jgi:uncharacterized membrane protein YqiK
MVEILLTLLVVAVVAIAIVYILSIWIYKRAPANMAFVRTGFLGTKVSIGRGALVLPVFHEIGWVSLETIKLIIGRSKDQAILTSDKIRIDLVTELYAHVGRTVEDVLTASRSLGGKTFDADQVRALLEAKVVSALRSYAATKTLNELHENRDSFARDIQANIIESFRANGLTLEEVTIVALEQTSKEYFNADNVFDAEGLRIITEITSEARRAVHDTEKRTTVSIRQKDLDTQLELLEIERREAFARAEQDKAVANEQALHLGEKQIYVLDQRKAVEEREIENEKILERARTEKEVAFTEEAKRRETSEIQKDLALERERRDREIGIIAKAKQEELANIERNLALEKAEIQRLTATTTEEEAARKDRHMAAEETVLAMRQRTLETRLAILELDKDEQFASVHQDQEVSNEKARVLSEKQRFILEQRWQIQEEEVAKEQALEQVQIRKEAAVIEESKLREAAEIRRTLAREREESDRQVALVAKDEELQTAEVRKSLAIGLEERTREIALIAKEQERERVDIQRFLAREVEERERQIALVQKTRELEGAEIERLKTTAEKERAAHEVDSVRLIADAERAKDIDRIAAENLAETRRVDEETSAEITRMHMITQSEARMESAEREAEATLTRARANSEAQKISADGIEREAGAAGRAEMEIDSLRADNTRRHLEAEALGLEAKAEALKKYNDAATFLELAKLHIEAERDVHIDQAKAMATALHGAQIRMYGGDGTVDTIRGMFTTGFGLGEMLEGVAQSLPDGLRDRLSANGIRGLFGQPGGGESLAQAVAAIGKLVQKTMRSRKARDVPVAEALATLEEQAGDDQAATRALGLLRDLNQNGAFDEVPFEKVWALLQAVAKPTN